MFGSAVSESKLSCLSVHLLFLVNQPQLRKRFRDELLLILIGFLFFWTVDDRFYRRGKNKAEKISKGLSKACASVTSIILSSILKFVIYQMNQSLLKSALICGDSKSESCRKQVKYSYLRTNI